jgi:hypothetical protein
MAVMTCVNNQFTLTNGTTTQIAPQDDLREYLQIEMPASGNVFIGGSSMTSANGLQLQGVGATSQLVRTFNLTGPACRAAIYATTNNSICDVRVLELTVQ